MSQPLFDRSALERHRNRARRSAVAGFLHQDAIFELQERLSLVNKTFSRVAVVTGWPEIWGQAFPTADLIADAETLEFAGAPYELIIHGFCLHWSNDPVGQMIQCRRALKSDGLFLAVMLGGQTLHELRTSLAEAEAQTRGGLSPRVAPMAEIRDLGGLLQRAGFALPVADSQTVNVAYQSLFHLTKDLRAMGETNALTARETSLTPRRLFLTAAERYADAFPAENGRVAATFEMIYLSGWAPDDSQPKPLRPGSATMRLADALSQKGAED